MTRSASRLKVQIAYILGQIYLYLPDPRLTVEYLQIQLQNGWEHMRVACRPYAFVLCIVLATYALAQSSTWDKVRYSGGTLHAEVDPSDWNNHLTVSTEQVVLQLSDGTKVVIPTKSIIGLSYGQQAH